MISYMIIYKKKLQTNNETTFSCGPRLPEVD